MLQKLLFPETVNLTSEESFDPTKTKMTVEPLLSECKERIRKNLSFEEGAVDFTAEKAAMFKAGRASKREAREKRESELKNWYGMKKQNPDKHEQNELSILRLRQYLEPGKFFRDDGLKKNPKYYQIGTVIEQDTFLGKRKQSNRKENKGSLFDQIHTHDEALGFTKRKFLSIQSEKAKTHKDRRYVKLKREMIKMKLHKKRSGKSGSESKS